MLFGHSWQKEFGKAQQLQKCETFKRLNMPVKDHVMACLPPPPPKGKKFGQNVALCYIWFRCNAPFFWAPLHRCVGWKGSASFRRSKPGSCETTYFLTLRWINRSKTKKRTLLKQHWWPWKGPVEQRRRFGLFNLQNRTRFGLGVSKRRRRPKLWQSCAWHARCKWPHHG